MTGFQVEDFCRCPDDAFDNRLPAYDPGCPAHGGEVRVIAEALARWSNDVGRVRRDSLTKDHLRLYDTTGPRYPTRTGEHSLTPVTSLDLLSVHPVRGTAPASPMSEAGRHRPVRVAIYLGGQDPPQEVQRDRCQAVAEANGWVVVAIVRDPPGSRAGWEQAKVMRAGGEVGRIVVLRRACITMPAYVIVVEEHGAAVGAERRTKRLR
jgi:hypothetical protein